MRSALAAAIAELRAHVEDAKWVPPENLHLTVSFLGWVPDERTDEIAAMLAATLADRAHVTTELAGLGAFPHAGRARVIWAGLDDEGGALGALAAHVQQGLAQIGFEPEARTWQAHVTLARLRRPHAVHLDVDVEQVTFDIDRVVLFRSRLQRPSPIYEPVAIVTLA